MSKIKSIRFIEKEYKFKKEFRITNSSSFFTKNLEVIIELESGIIGYGEASPSFRVNGEIFSALKPYAIEMANFIKNEDVKNYKKIFDITDKFFAFPSVKAAIQFAVIDALTRELGIKMYQFFGGVKNRIETDITISINSPEEMVKEAQQYYQSGFRNLKIKVGEDLYKDIEVVKAIYKELKDIEIVVDANMGYNAKEAIFFAKKLYSAGIDIKIFEQPVNANDFEGLKQVKFKTEFNVAADESARTKYDAFKLIKNEAVDFINIKLMKSGISDALSIIELAKSSNTGLMIGCMSESSLGINQSVQFAAGTGAFAHHDLDSSLLLIEEKFRGDFKINNSIITL